MPQEELDRFINLLQEIYEPERRASLEEILNHPWLQGRALPGVGPLDRLGGKGDIAGAAWSLEEDLRADMFLAPR